MDLPPHPTLMVRAGAFQAVATGLRGLLTVKSSALPPWTMERNLKRLSGPNMRLKKKGRLNFCAERLRSRTKGGKLHKAIKQSSCHSICWEIGQPQRKRLGQRFCYRITVWKCFLLAILEVSPFLSCARSWMGNFSNELITVSKLITALITCLLQMAN